MGSDPIKTREVSTVKFGMQVAGAHLDGATRAAHITDPTNEATNVTAIELILVVLENLGLVATS